MAGSKRFINATDKQISVTIMIRRGENPADYAGTQIFSLEPSQSSLIDYGNDSNIYLNGLSIVAMYEGKVFAEEQFVIDRGNDLDDQLNMNNTINISYSEESFHINAYID